MAESEDAILLRRRARRRLVGAIALVVFIVIVLPIVFDREPRPISQDLVIQIPSQDSGRLSARVPPPASTPAPPPAVPAEAQKLAEPGPAPAETEAPAPSGDAASKSGGKTSLSKAEVPAVNPLTVSEAHRAQAILEGQAYVISLGTYMNQANAKQLEARVAAAGFTAYSEIVKGAKGDQVRVRAGPFPTREAAEQAREKLKSRGWTVGAVAKR
jgi:DedD protein